MMISKREFVKDAQVAELFEALGKAEDAIDAYFEAKGMQRYEAVSEEDKYLVDMAVRLWTEQMCLGARLGKWCDHFHEFSTCGDCRDEELSEDEREFEAAKLEEFERVFQLQNLASILEQEALGL